MIAIIISHGDRYYPAELIGVTDSAVLPANSFRSAKQARRCARRRFGAGTLDSGKWQVKLHRGQTLQCGHVVKVAKVH